MGTDLAVIDRELTARKEIFGQLLPPSVTPDRLARTVMMSIERNQALLDCSPQSIINAATTAAVLGLECDGVTGQGYLVPYRGHATFQIGYKGYNTLGARAGYTITGGVVREGDDFDYRKGTDAFLHHRPMPGNRGRIVCAWAVAASTARPSIVEVLDVSEIEEIRAKSPGARKPDSPWNTAYPAMAEKTAKRRLARSMPMSVMQQAARLDGYQEAGIAATIDAGGHMHAEDAPGPAAAGVIIDVQPEDLTEPVGWPEFRTPAEFVKWSRAFLDRATTEQAQAWENQYRETLRKMSEHPVEKVREAAAELLVLYGEKIASQAE